MDKQQAILDIRVGDKVKRYFSCAGFVTVEEETVIDIDEKGIWLDNGDGNDPAGPFSLETGKYLGGEVFGATSWLDKDSE